MRKRYGRFEQQLLRELRLASCPERTVRTYPWPKWVREAPCLAQASGRGACARGTAGHLGCDPYGTRLPRKHATGTTTSTSEAEAQAEEHLGRRRLARVESGAEAYEIVLAQLNWLLMPMSTEKSDYRW